MIRHRFAAKATFFKIDGVGELGRESRFAVAAEREIAENAFARLHLRETFDAKERTVERRACKAGQFRFENV